MTYLYILAALALLGLAYMRFEAGFLQVNHVKFTKSQKGLKILHISDIHIDHLKVPAERVRKIILREKPDFVLMTGDYINSPNHIPKFLKFLDGITGTCNIYACLGNHDYKALLNDNEGLLGFMDDMAKRGVTLLHNRSVAYEKNGRKYNIIGIADMRYKHHNVEEALGSISRDAYANIAFSHNPDIVLEIPRSRVDYLFCGHFHGGQIWMPFDLEFKTLRYEKLCRMGIKRGLHKVNGINIYISKGLGSVLFPLRFMSRPEITVYLM